MVRRPSYALLAILLLMPLTSSSFAQAKSEAPPVNSKAYPKAKPAAPAKSEAPVPKIPHGPVLNVLIRKTLLTLNDANLSGNYTVLRELAAPSF